MIKYIAIIILLFLIYLFYCIFYPLLVAYNLKRKHGKIVLIRFYPLLGIQYYEKLAFKKYYDPIKIFVDDLNKNPDTKIIVSNIVFRPLITIVDPEFARDFSLKQGQQQYQYLKGSLMVEALFRKRPTRGQDKKNERKTWGKAFEFSHIQNYMGIVKRQMKSYHKELKEQQNNNRENKSFNPKIYKDLTNIACQVIMEGFWNVDRKISQAKIRGLSIGNQISKIFIDSLEYMKNTPSYFIKMRFLGEKAPYHFQSKFEKDIMDVSGEVRKYCFQEVQQRLDEFNIGNRKNDQLDILLENYQSPESHSMKFVRDQNEIVRQFMIFFFAGTHTTSLFGTYGLQQLAQMQQVQEDIRKEVTDYVEKNNIQVQDFEISDVNKLEKLNYFFKEFQRFNGQQRTVFIESIKNHKLGGMNIQKGWYLQIGIGELANAEKYWSNPQKFDMYRWQKEEIEKRQKQNPFVYIPFWAGPQNCIGQHLANIELKYIWISILSQYKLSLPIDYPFQKYRELEEESDHIIFTPI